MLIFGPDILTVADNAGLGSLLPGPDSWQEKFASERCVTVGNYSHKVR